MNFSWRSIFHKSWNSKQTTKHSILFCKMKSISGLLLRNELYCSHTHQAFRRRLGFLGSYSVNRISSSTRLLLHHGWCTNRLRSLLRAIWVKITEDVKAFQKGRVWFKTHCVLMVCLSILILLRIWSLCKSIRFVCIKRNKSDF